MISFKSYRPQAANLRRAGVVAVLSFASIGLLVLTVVAEWSDVSHALTTSISRATTFHPPTESVIAGIRAALISMGGGMLSATAIGVTLATFFIRENVQRLQYRTFKLLFRTSRFIRFVVFTATLAISSYTLAAIIEPINAYGVILAAAVILVLFLATVLWFLISSIRLLDANFAIRAAFEKWRHDNEQHFVVYEGRLADVRRQIANFPRAKKISFGRQERQLPIDCAEAVRNRTEALLAEVLFIIMAHVRQGDHETISTGCNIMADAFIKAVSLADTVFVRFRDETEVDFTNRIYFHDTLALTIQLAREAAANSNLTLQKIVVNMYVVLAESLLSVENIADDQKYNAFLPVYSIRDVALLSSRNGFPEGSTICLSAYMRLATAWRADSLLFTLTAGCIEEIAFAALPLRSGDFVLQRALLCLATLMNKVHAAEGRWYTVDALFKSMSSIIAAATKRYSGDDIPGLEGVLDPAITTVSEVSEEGLLNAIQEFVYGTIASVRVRGDSPDVSRIARFVQYVRRYLRFLKTTGETIAPSSLAEANTHTIIQTITECLRRCMDLRYGGISDDSASQIETLVRDQLGSFHQDLQKFSKQDSSSLVYLSVQRLFEVALAASENANSEIPVLVGELFIRFASDPPDDQGWPKSKFLYLAIVISAIDKSDKTLSALVKTLQSGFWTDYKARFAGSASEIREILARANQEPLPDRSTTYGFVEHEETKILSVAGVDRLRAVQRQVLDVISVAEMPPQEAAEISSDAISATPPS